MSRILITAVIVCLSFTGALAQDGAVVHLVDPGAVTGVDTSTTYDRGVVVIMLRGFEVSEVRVRLDLASPGDITATIYESNNYNRGVAIASNSIAAADLGNVEHSIPLTATLDACQYYEVVVDFGDVDGWDYLFEPDAYTPFIRHGVLLTGTATINGSAASTQLPHITLVGTPSPGTTSDLTPSGFGWEDATCSGGSSDRSIFVRALRTITVTSLGFDYAPEVSLGTLTARIYDGTGMARGALLAEGTLETDVDERRIWKIPVASVLREGHVYELAVTFPAALWGCRSEGDFGVPFAIGDAIEVLDGAADGDPIVTVLPHFTVEWESEVGGVGVDMARDPGLPPLSSTDATTTRSVFVYSQSDQVAASLGWYADVPAGETITATIYNSSGTTRGPMVSQGSIVSTGGGERWHDVPVSGTLYKLQDYELNVSVGSVNLWRYWDITGFVGIPYYPTPEIEVFGAGDGDGGAVELPYLRFNGCYDYVVAVDDGPVRPATLVLRAPYPNPGGGESIVEYELDRAGEASIQVFDVSGRLVATLLERSLQPAGPGVVTLRGTRLPAGVYFVRLEMPHATVSRKVSIVR